MCKENSNSFTQKGYELWKSVLGVDLEDALEDDLGAVESLQDMRDAIADIIHNAVLKDEADILIPFVFGLRLNETAKLGICRFLLRNLKNQGQQPDSKS